MSGYTPYPPTVVTRLRKKVSMSLSFAGVPPSTCEEDRCLYFNCFAQRSSLSEYGLCEVHDTLADVTLRPENYARQYHVKGTSL